MEEKLEALVQLEMDFENAGGKRGGDEGQDMSYSKAAKKAAQYYAITSAYR